MQPLRMLLPAAVTLLALLPQSALGQARTVDVRAHFGHATGLDDTPPYAWVGGATVTVATGPHSRFGIEVWRANMFGPYARFKRRARLFTGVWEYEFAPGRRVNPYVVAGFGYTQYRTLTPNRGHYIDPSRPEFRWDKQGSIHYQGGLGIRLFVTRRLFVAPEVRTGFPLLRSTVAVGYAF